MLIRDTLFSNSDLVFDELGQGVRRGEGRNMQGEDKKEKDI